MPFAVTEIDSLSSSAFQGIPFTDWFKSARDSAGYVKSVEDFSDLHGSLQDMIEFHLQEAPAERARYVELAKVKPTSAVLKPSPTDDNYSCCPKKALPIGL